MIVIVQSRPEWPEEFRRLARDLRASLHDLSLRVDHIGSASAPRLAAKDVLHVEVTAAAPTLDVDAAVCAA